MAEDLVSVETTRYEMMMILLSDLGEEGSKKELDEIREVVTSHGGNVFHEDIWGVMDLAYPIKKQDQGYYVVWNLDFPNDQVSEMEKTFNINQSLVRYMMVKIPGDYEFKSVETYQAEFEAERKREEEEKEAEEKKSAAKRAEASKAKKVEVKKEPVKEVEAKAEEPKEAKKEAEEKVEDKKDNLEAVDAKLKSIISDPDISL